MALKQHPLKGRKQSPEHVRKRTEASMRTKANWSGEYRAKVCAGISAINRARGPETRKKLSESRKGITAWNKGNNWRDQYTAEENRAINAKLAKKRRAANPMVRIHDSMSAQIRTSLNGNKAGRSWEELVGYTVNDLAIHLEDQFCDGMSWDNAGKWHIDHIVPKSAFTFESVDDGSFKECWSLDNLQPLWAVDNLRKGIAVTGTEGEK